MFPKMDFALKLLGFLKHILHIAEKSEGCSLRSTEAPFTHPSPHTMPPCLAPCQWNITGQRVVPPVRQGGGKYKQTTKQRVRDGLK